MFEEPKQQLKAASEFFINEHECEEKAQTAGRSLNESGS